LVSSIEGDQDMGHPLDHFLGIDLALDADSIAQTGSS
jgi:hypothetical protein